jgi:hypothetical protein
MASQLQRSTSLITQNEQLLAALREVSVDPTFDAKGHPAVMLLLSKVCMVLTMQWNLNLTFRPHSIRQRPLRTRLISLAPVVDAENRLHSKTELQLLLQAWAHPGLWIALYQW